MIFYKTAEEIELIRQNCLLVCKVLTHVASVLKPGLVGSKIDKEAEELIRDHHAEPGFKGYGGFPATLCVSVNDVVVHGIPNHEQVFREGDIVSVDCGVFHNGYFGDAAYTFPLGEVSDSIMHLLSATKTSLYEGIQAAQVGKRLGDISHAVQHYIEKVHGYKVVRELVGHGIGRELHEDPQVPNYGKRGRGNKLKEGLVIAIEPMVNMKKKEVFTGKDGWSIHTKDKLPSAHFEHTIALTKDGPDILSDHVMVEKAVKQNDHIQFVEMLEDVVV